MVDEKVEKISYVLVGLVLFFLILAFVFKDTTDTAEALRHSRTLLKEEGKKGTSNSS